MPPGPGPLSPAQTRLGVNPVLTSLVRGFDNEEQAFDKLFPIINVPARAGTIVEFDPEAFRKTDTRRAPGARRERKSSGYGKKLYACTQRALDGTVPVEDLEEAAAVPGIDMQRAEVMTTMEMMSLQIEVEAAELATNSANYPAGHHIALNGNARWDNDASKPNKAIAVGRQKIRQGIGRRPNVLVLGYSVFEALCNHKEILDRVRYTETLKRDGTPSVDEMNLAAYFKVEKVVVGAMMSGEAGDFEDVWGKHAILAYSDSGSTTKRTPSFGYTYRREGYPIARSGWLDETCDTWVYPVTSEDTPVIVGNAAGYLLSSVVA